MHKGFTFVFLSLIACHLSIPAFAEPKEFQLEGKDQIRLEVPEKWQTAKDLFGLPLTLLGPEKGGGRPVIYVSSSGKDNVQFDPQALEANQKDYREGREQWLEKHKGFPLEFFPYKNEKWASSVEVHQMGYRYQINGLIFSEMSFFAVCKGRLFHLKWLLRDAHREDYEPVVEKVVRSFDCKVKS
jgi:hypothetical protein